MKTIEGYKYFGYFTGMPYGKYLCDETFKDYPVTETAEERRKILQYLDTLDPALTSEPTYDLVTGELLQGGMYEDMEYGYPTDFVEYYRRGLVGFPREYLESLRARNII